MILLQQSLQMFEENLDPQTQNEAESDFCSIRGQSIEVGGSGWVGIGWKKMAETIHGTKANAVGPSHRAGLLCQDGQCEECAAKIFALHCSFFRDEFKVQLLSCVFASRAFEWPPNKKPCLCVCV